MVAGKYVENLTRGQAVPMTYTGYALSSVLAPDGDIFRKINHQKHTPSPTRIHELDNPHNLVCLEIKEGIWPALVIFSSGRWSKGKIMSPSVMLLSQLYYLLQNCLTNVSLA